MNVLEKRHGQELTEALKAVAIEALRVAEFAKKPGAFSFKAKISFVALIDLERALATYLDVLARHDTEHLAVRAVADSETPVIDPADLQFDAPPLKKKTKKGKK